MLNDCLTGPVYLEERGDKKEGAMSKELKFKQIAVVGDRKPVEGEPGGGDEFQPHLFGLTEDGRVYYLRQLGWIPLEMKSTES